jgi:hypothetical protein
MSRYRLTLLAAVIVVSLSAACTDSTAPNPATEPQLSETQGGNNKIVYKPNFSETQGANN